MPTHHRTQTTLLLLPLLIQTTLAASTCTKKYPIYVDIHNRTVTGGSSEFQYGAFIGVGVPYQNQSLWPSLSRNETTFAARSFCASSELAECVDRTGGSVDFNASVSWREDMEYQSLDQRPLVESSVHGRDDMHLFVHYLDPSPASVVNVTGTPVEFALSGDTAPGIVGLGSASTVLDSLVRQEKISSRSFGLYTGNAMLRGDPKGSNGSLTFGGYDAARMTEEVHTYDVDLLQADYLPVTVSEVMLSIEGDDELSLMDDQPPFEARITTDQYPLRLPPSIVRAFASAIRANDSSTGSDGSLLAQTGTPSNISLTIRLSDDLEVNIPPSVLINSAGRTAIESVSSNSTGPYLLSTAFLSQVYLVADFDARKFHLSRALFLSQAISDPRYVIPTALCAGETPSPHDFGPKNTGFVRDGLIGAVVGGVVGGIAIVLAGLWLFVWWRRRKMMSEEEKEWSTVEGKERGSDEVEMEALSPAGKKMVLPWMRHKPRKGKEPVNQPVEDETEYRGRGDYSGI